jgi:hypothetical protein
MKMFDGASNCSLGQQFLAIYYLLIQSMRFKDEILCYGIYISRKFKEG